LAEIVPVVSEALEAQIRNLLPSQRGFGEDLQASNVIMPIIDLTAAAQGTSTPEILQTALAFGSQTAFSVNNATTTLANATGFWRFLGSIISSSGTPVGNTQGALRVTDGLSTKALLSNRNSATSAAPSTILPFDFVIFLAAGESVVAGAATNCNIEGTYRQIADVNGNLINPSGFTPQ